MLDIEPGREDDFRRLQRWLTASYALDTLLERTERAAPVILSPSAALRIDSAKNLAERGQPTGLRQVPTESARAQRVEAPAVASGTRARLAARLARLALALHADAASAAPARRH